MRPTSNKEPVIPYRSKKMMSQTVSTQMLALLHRPQLKPELEEEEFQEVQDEFMINYFNVTSTVIPTTTPMTSPPAAHQQHQYSHH